MISAFPDMYPVREHRPFAGFRYLLARICRVSHGMAEDALTMLAVVPRGGARSRITCRGFARGDGSSAGVLLLGTPSPPNAG